MESSSAPRRTCQALSSTGSPCYIELHTPGYWLCSSHHQEFTQLYTRYKQADSRYESLSATTTGPAAEIREKLRCGENVVALRDEVHRRFFNLHPNNRGHIQRILRVHSEVRELRAALSTLEESARTSTPAESIEDTTAGPEVSPGSEATAVVYRSLIAPDVPMSDLDHLPRDHPAVQLKEATTFIVEGLTRRLYELAPYLDDSRSARHSQIWPQDSTAEKAGDAVMRFVFREYLMWKADADTLHRASVAESVHDFIAQNPSDLLDYIKFFETFGREDTLHFLRDAICDYLLPIDPPTDSSARILGAPVATDDRLRTMSAEGWDILFRYFGDSGLVDWYNLEQFCVTVRDHRLVQKLIAFGRYGKDGEKPGWLNSEKQVSQESTLALISDFVPICKGYSDPPIPPLTTSNGVQTAKQSRCYLVGRMSRDSPHIEAVTRELVKRIARYIVLVSEFDGDHLYTRSVVARNDGGEDLWITRTKSCPIGQPIENVGWSVEWSLQHIHRDIAMMSEMLRVDKHADYREFIIIDRAPGLGFGILDDVAGIAARATGYQSMKDLLHSAIKSCVPECEQSMYIKRLTLQDTAHVELQFPVIHYEGSRTRSWSFADQNRELLRSYVRSPRSRRDQQVMRCLVDDMEAEGFISPLDHFQTPATCPVVLTGSDGKSDVYFPFETQPLSTPNSHIDRGVPAQLSTSQATATLESFAERYKASHSGFIAAKAKIQTHYCACPLSIRQVPTERAPRFRTAEGLLYRWNVSSFDWPMSSRLWQGLVDRALNVKLAFARCVWTTIVICAKDSEDAEKNIKELQALAVGHDWQIIVPPVRLWKSDVSALGLEHLWSGIEPDV